MIGNAHIDPVWLWQWPEGYQEVRATFRVGARPDGRVPRVHLHLRLAVCFCSGSRRPTRRCSSGSAQRVAEGRWQVVGGWWVEPDCNIPGGESFVRQALYGQRYLLEPLRHRSRPTGANVDSFGHNASIPQILRGAAWTRYVFLRPGPHEKALPAPALLVGVARRLARARLPDPARVLRAAAATSASTSRRRSRSCRTARPS